MLSGRCPVIYGPVKSRRHGISLGINLGNPNEKICTWNCLYCQFGFNKIGGRNYFPEREKIIKDLTAVLEKEKQLDSVTLAGNSEPTSHPHFLQIIEDVLSLRKKHGRHWIFNCLSNGSELYREDVIRGCDLLDEIWIKLDCADDKLHSILNRPTKEAQLHMKTIKDYIGGMRRLKNLRIQTLLWKNSKNPNFQNWTKENLDGLISIFKDLKPVSVFITTIQRKTLVSDFEPIEDKDLEAFAVRIKQLGIAAQAFGGLTSGD